MVRFMFLAILGVVTICLLYVLAIIYSHTLFGDIDFSQSGTFGDSWGALTSIFSALGFCGVLWTLKSQNDSFRKVEEESARREKIELRRDFENSFFNMMNLLQTIINDMRVTNKTTRTSMAEGRGVFIYFFKAFREYVKQQNNYKISTKDNADMLSSIVHTIGCYYSNYFHDRSQNLSHYYRFLYNAFKFIDESEITEEAKRKYANILRAQISNYELIMLFYNSLSTDGSKFIFFFEKYAVLDNLPVRKLIYSRHVLLVDKSCWGENHLALEEFE